MNALRARIRQLSERIDALSIRERTLLIITILAVLFLLWDTIVMQPIHNRQDHVQQQLAESSSRVAELSTSIQQLAGERSRDPNVQLRERRNALASEIDRLETRLSELHGGVVETTQAVGILDGLLTERSGLRVVSLENLPVQPLRDRDDNAIEGIYVHRVQLRIETSFDGVLAYLAMIENMSGGVFWESMSLSVPGWPVNRIELVLYSLALDESWLGV